MSVYIIRGANGYRGHPCGKRVEMVLDMATEARAVGRGAIELVERSTPRLYEGSYRLPAADAAGRGAELAEFYPSAAVEEMRALELVAA